jgi:hypothetical protein
MHSGDDMVSGKHPQNSQPIAVLRFQVDKGSTSAELEEGPIWNPGAADRTRVGDIKFKDVSGPDGVPDGVINNSDLTIIGTPYPDFYYGMTNTFSYQNVSLSINLAGSQGNQIYSNAMVIYRLIRSRSRTLATERNFWKSEEDPGDAIRPCDTPTGGMRQASTRYMDTGSYLRINNITLTYIIPERYPNHSVHSGCHNQPLYLQEPFL